MDDELLGIPEVAELLHTSESTVRYYRQTGQGPKSWKAGRRVRYWKKDVVSWLNIQELATAVGGCAMKRTEMADHALQSIHHAIISASATLPAFGERKQKIYTDLPGCIKGLSPDELEWVIFALSLYIERSNTHDEWDGGEIPDFSGVWDRLTE